MVKRDSKGTPKTPKTYGRSQPPEPPPAWTPLPKIIKAPLDTKRYEAIQLDNGMKVLLISTCEHKLELNGECRYEKIREFNEKTVGIPKAKKKDEGSCCCGGFDESRRSKCKGKNCQVIQELKNGKPKCCVGHAAACLVNAVGSFSDPSDVQGMAHLCEHAMILGSANYPQEFYLFDLVNRNGGDFNASTLAEYTDFFFSCDSPAFEEILDVFSDMIANPLLRSRSIEKEVEAVDSEFYLKNTCDYTRISDFMGYLAKRNHPFYNFSWGIKESLGNIKELAKKLTEWQRRNYGSNYMTLCLQGPFPIDKLREMAMKYFSRVRNNCCRLPKEDLLAKGHPYDRGEFNRIFHIVPVSNIKLMQICWSLSSDIWKDFKTNQLLYLRSVLNTQGKGGICHYLRSKHWITSFTSGCTESEPMFQNSFTTMYVFSIYLTNEGLKNREEIIFALYSYVKFLSKAGAQEYIYDELKKTQATMFHYHDWEEMLECTQEYAMALQNFPPEYILTSKTLILEFNQGKIDNLLKLMDPRKANIIVMAPEFRDEEKHQNVMNGRFVFTVKKIEQEQYEELEKSKVTDYKFRLPDKNTFLAKQLDHFVAPEEFIQPTGSAPMTLLHEDPEGRYWLFYRNEEKSPCATRRLPYAVYHIIFHSPKAKLGNLPLMDMWAFLLNIFMVETINSAFDNLYKHSVSVKGDNLVIEVEGPSFHLTDLLQTVLSVFHEIEKHLDADPRYFEDKKAEQLNEFDDLMMNVESYPWDIQAYLLRQNDLSKFHHKMKLKRTNFGEFHRFIKRFRSQMFLIVETAGSITTKQVEIIKKLICGLNFRPYRVPRTLAADRAMKIPLGCKILRIRQKHASCQSSIVRNHYQFGPLVCEEEIQIFELFHCILVRNAMLKLRTDEQLGYRVRMEKWEKCGCKGLNFLCIVKTDNYTTEFVNDRMDKFIADFFKFHFKSEKAFKLLISKYTKDKVSYKKAREMYTEYLLPRGSEYRKLSIQLVGHKTSETRTTKDFIKACKDHATKTDEWLVYDKIPSCFNKEDFILDVEVFKKEMECLPNLDPQPEEQEV